MNAEFGKVIGSWVAFVLGKTVFGKLPVKILHDAIPLDFSNDAGRGNAQAEPIAADQGRLFTRKIGDAQAVDQDVGRMNGQGMERRTHRPVGRPQDVPSVDLLPFAKCRGPYDVSIRSQ